jgi:hypothetical protein
VADALLRCARAPKCEVLVGRGAGGLALLHALLPGPTQRLLGWYLEGAHFRPGRQAPPTSGAILADMGQGTDARGGWGTPLGSPLPAASNPGHEPPRPSHP